MAIVGIGIDIVKVSRIHKILLYSGTKLAKKILSNQEWEQFLKKKTKHIF